MTKQYTKKCPTCGKLFAFEKCRNCKDKDVKCWCKECYPIDTLKLCGKDLEIRKAFVFR